MSKFIAAMDNSGGSAGGVLDLYEQGWTDDDKMEKIHEFRLRMINSPDFNSNNIWAGIVYHDSVERGVVDVLLNKGISTILKIDSGCESNGMLKDFDVHKMVDYALAKGCYGTKMRSIVKDKDTLVAIVGQQFLLAEIIAATNLIPIVEPEIPIDHAEKADMENFLNDAITSALKNYKGKCILKLTIPETPNLYSHFAEHPKVERVVGLSGGYTTEEACNRLANNNNMSASFSRALAEGLKFHQSDEEFNTVIGNNIQKIVSVS